MAWNMPDGATTDQYDRYMGYDRESEDPENEYPLVPCPRCHDYPCRCMADWMEAEELTEEECPF